MTRSSNLARLLTWLSPVFPTGGFAYSSGLEAAVASGLVTDRDALKDWLEGGLSYGTMRNDALYLAEAWRGCRHSIVLSEVADLALAMSGSAGRYLEVTAQGAAFIEAISNWPDMTELNLPDTCPLPVAIGAAAGFCQIDMTDALVATLQNSVSNQLQCAIRLSVIGQKDAASILAELESVIEETAGFASGATLDDLGTATINSDIMCMKHETLAGRMFRT